METQARYIFVGLFAIVIVAAACVFAYWLNNGGNAGGQALYRIRFDAPVIGLRPGVAVLFNGMRVGEVNLVGIDAANPKILMARITVDATTPVSQDTRVGIDSQGLMGSPAVSLTGGASTLALKPGTSGEPPLLIANIEESESLGRGAKSALTQLNGILADNAQPLSGAIVNLGAFAAVLARNSGRVDNILAGLEKMTGNSAPKATPLTYVLAAPEFTVPETPLHKPFDTQIAVQEPTALVAFETQKVLVASTSNELQPLETGQWADSLPKLVQAKIVQSLENAGFAHVAKTTDGFSPEIQLLLEIRAFEVSLGSSPAAHVEISAKLLGADGKIAAARSFLASSPAAGVDTPSATAALNEAFQKVARDLVDWAQQAI